MTLLTQALLERIAHEKRIQTLAGDYEYGDDDTVDQAIDAATQDVYGMLLGEYAQAHIDASAFCQQLAAIRALHYLSLHGPVIDQGVSELFEWTTEVLKDLRAGRRDLADSSGLVARTEDMVLVTTEDQQPVFSQTEYDVDGEAMDGDEGGTLDNY